VSNNSLDVIELYNKVLGEKIDSYDLPPPSFEVMQCKILEFNAEEKFMIVKIPVLKDWLNPYGTMQGGMIIAAVDNAVGPLSLLVAPKNMTRNIESKLLKPILMESEFIYVKATLSEEKKRRLTFNIIVKDKDENIYAKATVINWIL
jgi:acyl-coenzyme A thioesterase PaaI-like protein